MAEIQTYGALHKTVKEIQKITNMAAEHLNDGVLQIGTLAVSATDDQFKTTTECFFVKDGIQHQIAATDNYEFQSAYTINTAAAAAIYFGAFLIEATGVITPVVSGKASSADQVYATAALAIAALPTVTTGSVEIGRIVLSNNTSASWTANTDDMVAASDVASVTITDAVAATTLLAPEDLNTMTNPDGAPAQ